VSNQGLEAGEAPMVHISPEIKDSVVEILDDARKTGSATINLYKAAQRVHIRHSASNVAIEDIVELLVAHGKDCCFEINSKSMQSVLYD
jgi:hypothetical protein